MEELTARFAGIFTSLLIPETARKTLEELTGSPHILRVRLTLQVRTEINRQKLLLLASKNQLQLQPEINRRLYLLDTDAMLNY